MTALEALKWLIDNGYIEYENGWQESPYILESINTIEKELKALEIIKNKKVYVRFFLKYCDDEIGLPIYNSQVLEEQKLTKEEYDLLKEALG